MSEVALHEATFPAQLGTPSAASDGFVGWQLGTSHPRDDVHVQVGGLHTRDAIRHLSGPRSDIGDPHYVGFPHRSTSVTECPPPGSYPTGVPRS